MKTARPDDVSLLEQRLADRIEPWRPTLLQKITAGVAVAALYVMTVFGSGCDGNGPNGNGDAISPVPSGYSVGNSITPANGTTVGPDDDPLEVGVDTPALAPECSADPDCAAEATSGLDVVIDVTYDNVTPGNSSDDETLTVASHTGVPFGSYTSGDLDLGAAHGSAGLSDGEGIEAHVALTFTDSKGENHTIEGTVNYTYESGPTGPRVTGCNVVSSHVGANISIYCHCSEAAESFSLTGGPDGVIIGASGSIISPRTMEASDVGLHTYTVTCTAGGVTSPDYEFKVPVDEHGSRLVLHCASGTEERLLLPETSVDAVATACGTGFNPALKPDTASDPDYVLDVNHTCVQGAIDGLTTEEQEAHTHYNEGTTVDDVYSSCTVDFTQVSYTR